MSHSVGRNPYAVTNDANGNSVSEVEAIRQTYLHQETSIKSLGTLFMLGAVLSALIAFFSVVAAASMVSKPDQPLSAAGLALGCAVALGLAVLCVFLAVGLWQLKPWARIVATIISAIGLLAFPLGTIISIYFIGLLQSHAGSVVFSEEYKRVIAATPRIKYRLSIVVYIALAIVLALILVAVIAFVTAAPAYQ